MICVTVSLYALAKQLGAAGASDVFRSQLKAPTHESLPCVRTIARLRELDRITLAFDLGGSAAAKMRCRAAHTAHRSGADAWVSIDDDVEASADTCRAILEAVAGDVPAVCVAPTLLRGSDVVGVAVEPGQVSMARELPSGGAAVPCIAGAFGMVAVNRAALAAAIEAHPELAFTDDDGEEKCALFLEDLARKRWWGEDLSFFRRLAPGTRVECLVRGSTVHDGAVLELAEIPTRPRLELADWNEPARATVVESVPPAAPATQAAPEAFPAEPATSPERPSVKVEAAAPLSPPPPEPLPEGLADPG